MEFILLTKTDKGRLLNANIKKGGGKNISYTSTHNFIGQVSKKGKAYKRYG